MDRRIASINPRAWVFGLLILAILAMAGSVAAAPAEAGAAPVATVLPDGSRVYGQGSVRFVENIPILRLAGSYREMGYQYGVLLREELQKAYRSYNLLKDSILDRYPWYVRPFGRIALRMMARYQWRRIPLDYQEELQGLADGSGLSYEDILFSAVFLELASAYCTSIIQRTETGIIHGRNLDFQPLFLGRYPVVVEYNAVGKNQCLSFGVLGYTGVFTAVNNKGLSLSLNAAFGYQRNVRDTPMTFKARTIMEHAATLNELESSLKGYAVDTGWVLVAASKTENDGAIYDICLDRNMKNPLDAGKSTVYALNRYVHPEAAKIYTEISVGASYYNTARRDRLVEFLSAGGIRGVADMITILSDADFGTYRDLIGSGNGTINNERTLQTVVFDHGGRAVYFALSRGYAAWARYYRYDLDRREITVYRAADERLRALDLQAYVDWYENAEIKLIVGDYRSAAEETLRQEKLHPGQIIALDMLYESAKNCLAPADYLAALDRAIAGYKDYGLLYQIKGKLLLSLGRCEEAAASLLEGVAAPVVYPVERMSLFGLLAQAYQGMQQTAQAVEYAGKCLALLAELNRDYALGPAEKALKEAMLRITGVEQIRTYQGDRHADD